MFCLNHQHTIVPHYHINIFEITTMLLIYITFLHALYIYIKKKFCPKILEANFVELFAPVKDIFAWT